MRVGGDRWVGWDWGPIGPGGGMVAIGGNVIVISDKPSYSRKNVRPLFVVKI